MTSSRAITAGRARPRQQPSVSPFLTALLFVSALSSSALVYALPGDIDESGRVDGLDLIILSRALGSEPGDDHWNANADLNGDEVVDNDDLAILREYFGQTGVVESCWVESFSSAEIVKVSATGAVLVSLSDYSRPHLLHVDRSDGTVWIALTDDDEVRRLSANGEELLTLAGVTYPCCLTVNPKDGTIWIGEEDTRRLHRVAGSVADGYDLSADTGSHVTISGFADPRNVDVHYESGACWVVDSDGEMVVRVVSDAPDGYSVATGTGFHRTIYELGRPGAISVDQRDGTAWVTDFEDDRVVKISSNAFNILVDIPGFNVPWTISVNPVDGTAWA